MFDFEILIRYFKGQASPDEAMRVDDWIDKEAANRIFFNELFAAWLEAGDEQYKLADVQAEWQRFVHGTLSQQRIELKRNTKRKSYVKLSMAAGLLLLVGVATYLLMFQREPEMVAHNTSVSPIQVTLPDGSTVSIQPGATLNYPKQFTTDKRIVSLSGDAFFSVTHNAQQPFIIRMTQQLEVKVLGTSFHITDKSDSVIVAVTTGKVAFYKAGDTAIVPAGETGVFKSSDNKFYTHRSVHSGSFQFDDVTIGEVFRQLEQHFKVKIHVQDNQLYNCRLSAGFESESLEDILKVIAATFTFEYNVEHTDIYISGGACK